MKFLLILLFLTSFAKAEGAAHFEDDDGFARTDSLHGLPITIMAWAQYTSDIGWQAAFDFHASGSRHFYLGKNSTTDNLNYWNGSTNFQGTNLVINTWYHIALVCSTGGTNNVYVYLDGELDFIGDRDSFDDPLTIEIGGRADNTSDEWFGDVAAFKKWNRGLTQAEIQTERGQYAPVDSTDLTSYMPMNDATIAEMLDDQAMEVTWTELGTPTVSGSGPNIGEIRKAYSVIAGGGGDFTTVQDCANGVNAGDTCAIQNGAYSGWSVPDGLPGLPIVFMPAEGHSPTITGEVDLDGTDHATIYGLTFDGGFISSSTFSGVAASWIHIKDCTFDDVTTISIALKGENFLVEGNTFTNIYDDAVRTFGTKHVIRNNIATDIIDTADEHLDFYQSFCSNASGGVNVQEVLIENNLYARVSGPNVHFSLINSTVNCPDPVTNIISRYNKVNFIGSLASTIDNNSINEGTKRNVIYNNTYVKIREGSFISWQTATDDVRGSDSSSGINNLFYQSMYHLSARGFARTADSGWVQKRNLYFYPGETMTFQSQVSADAIKNLDPLLTDIDNDDFSLQDGSPAIDSGLHLTEVATADGGSGTTLVVEQAEFFQPGWAGTEGDWIAITDTNTTAQISSIDYSTNTITLVAGVARNDGDPVYLYKKSDGERVFYGAAPNIGAWEFTVEDTTSTPTDKYNPFYRIRSWFGIGF